MTATRQLAILTADVVGYYSRLMGANETAGLTRRASARTSTPMSPSATPASRQRVTRIGCENKYE